MTTRTTLLDPVHSLLKALTSPPPNQPITALLATFTTQPPPIIHEHGLPQLAPFLGRTFTGTDGIARYFELLTEYLSIAHMNFEPEELWLVDEGNMTISLRGTATFTWKSTRQGWDETFVYRIALAEEMGAEEMGAEEMGAEEMGAEEMGADENGGGSGGKKGLKVCEYRVWADTGAAYLAKLGRLGDLGAYSADGIHVEGLVEGRRLEAGQTRRSIDRKKSGCQDVLGAGLNVYGSCG